MVKIKSLMAIEHVAIQLIHEFNSLKYFEENLPIDIYEDNNEKARELNYLLAMTLYKVDQLSSWMRKHVRSSIANANGILNRPYYLERKQYFSYRLRKDVHGVCAGSAAEFLASWGDVLYDNALKFYYFSTPACYQTDFQFSSAIVDLRNRFVNKWGILPHREYLKGGLFNAKNVEDGVRRFSDIPDFNFDLLKIRVTNEIQNTIRVESGGIPPDPYEFPQFNIVFASQDDSSSLNDLTESFLLGLPSTRPAKLIRELHKARNNQLTLIEAADLVWGDFAKEITESNAKKTRNRANDLLDGTKWAVSYQDGQFSLHLRKNSVVP